MENVPAEVKHLMSFAPKKDIATALVRVRSSFKRDKKTVLELENRISEMIIALELLPENVTHKEVMNRIYRLTGVLTEQSDMAEAVAEGLE